MSLNLKQALIHAGDEDQVHLLSSDAEKLTESDLENFMNGKSHENMSLGTISSIRKLAKTRLQKGQSVLPFHLKGLEANDADDNIGGGIW